MARWRKMTNEELKKALQEKLEDGKARLERLKVEFTACRNTYQGLVQKGYGGVDASLVSALLVSQTQAQTDDVYLDSLKLITLSVGLHAKLCISDPAVTTKPFNRDYPNLRAAEIAQVVVENVRQSTHLKAVLEKSMYLNCANLATGVIFNGWDKDAGRVLMEPEKIKELSESGKLEETDLQMEGDYEFRGVAPDDFIIDPNATEFDIDADWCAERRSLPIEAALYQFPDNATEIHDLAEKQSQKRDKEAGNPKGGRRTRAITIWEYWERAQPWNGMDGSHVIFAETGDDEILILKREGNPFHHKQLPYAVLTDLDVDGDPYGLSRCVLGLPAQEAVNQLFMQIIANIELHGNVHLIVPEGQATDDTDSNHPAVRYYYNAATGEKPTHLQPANVTSDVWRLHTLLMQELDQLYASSEFDRGEVNRELSSYTVQTAIERSEAKMVRLFSKKKAMLKRLYEQILSNTIQFATEDRLLKVGGQEESHNYEFFKGSDLIGQYGVFVDYGMYLPIDPHARKQQVLELVKSGIFEKAGGNMQKLISILVDGDMLDIRDLFDQAKRVQREEFMRLIEGEPAPVQPWHEHESHYAECVAFMQKKYFETLPDDAKQRILEHSNKHKEEAAKIIAAAQPKPPQPPGGAAPELPPGQSVPATPPPAAGAPVPPPSPAG